MVVSHDDALFTQEERRPPHTFPVRPNTMADVRPYLAGLENWFADSLFARQQYLALYHTLGLQERYGLSHTPTVLGRDGWIFLGNHYAGVMNYTRNDQPLSAERVERCLAQIRTMAEACRQRNVPFVLMVVPTKHTLYSEYLPGWLQIKSDFSLLDAVLEKAKAEGLPFLYPKQDFLAKQRELTQQGRHLYYKDDTHWNFLGALAGYEVLRDALKRQNYTLPSLSYITAEPSHEERTGDLIGIGRYRDSLKASESYELSVDPAQQHTAQKNGKLLFFGDSFGGRLRPLLDAAFQDVTQPHVLESNMPFIEALDTYKPDVLIYEIVERSYAGIEDLLGVLGKK